MLKKRFYYPITSERMALRATARLWRYIAKRGLQKKPMTRWRNACPCCEWSRRIELQHCTRCPLLGFWGSVPRTDFDPCDLSIFKQFEFLCTKAKQSAYLKWANAKTKVSYYAQRIRWAAMRKLYDRYSS